MHEFNDNQILHVSKRVPLDYNVDRDRIRKKYDFDSSK